MIAEPFGVYPSSFLLRGVVMLLWTIQPYGVWDRLQRNRRVYAHRKRYAWSYRWLEQQMCARLRGYSGRPLWWAYCTKPDLRIHRFGPPCGEVHVRLELDCDRIPHVRFPCWAWDLVFCGHYLAFSRKESRDWEKRCRRAVPDEDLWPLPEPWGSELEASWQRLFDPDLPVLSWYPRHTTWRTRPEWEAVFEVLRFRGVRDVTIFHGARRP